MATTVWEQEVSEKNRELFDRGFGTPHPPEYGEIIEAQQVPTEDGQGGFVVRVRLDKYVGKDTKPFWMGLAYPIDVISMLFGDEDSLIGRRCRVEYYSAREQDGLVFIVHDRNFRGNLDKAKKVRYFGGTLCPAGS